MITFCSPSPHIIQLLVHSSWDAVSLLQCTIQVPCFFIKYFCGMSCYFAGTGTGQDGHNQQTVKAGGRAASGEWCLVMRSEGTLRLATCLVLTEDSSLLGYDALLLGCVSWCFEGLLGNSNHDTASHPRRLEFSTRPLWKPQIVHGILWVESWDWHSYQTSPPVIGVCYDLILKLV